MDSRSERKRLVVGISGASCANLAIRLLEAMAGQEAWETHLVVTEGARRTLEHETSYSFQEVAALATQAHDLRDIGASIASGTFRTEGMVVIPCSMKTVAGIAHGYSENLLLRAADVTLKERRKLVLLARETPLSLIHLKNMVELAGMGVVIMPPVLTSYQGAASVEAMEHHLVGKVMSEFGMEFSKFRRWTGERHLAGPCQDAPNLSGGLDIWGKTTPSATAICRSSTPSRPPPRNSCRRTCRDPRSSRPSTTSTRPS